MILPIQVCQAAWEVIYCCSHERTTQLVREVTCGNMEQPKREPKVSKKECKADTIRNWLTIFFDGIADRMPDDNNQHGRESWHLPAWMTKYYIHKQCLEQLNNRQSGELKHCTGRNIFSSIINNGTFVSIDY